MFFFKSLSNQVSFDFASFICSLKVKILTAVVSQLTYRRPVLHLTVPDYALSSLSISA